MLNASIDSLTLQAFREYIAFLQEAAAENESQLRSHKSVQDQVTTESQSQIFHLSVAFEVHLSLHLMIKVILSIKSN